MWFYSAKVVKKKEKRETFDQKSLFLLLTPYSSLVSLTYHSFYFTLSILNR